MPGVGWAAYNGENEAFYVEQTILEAKAHERIKQAEKDGVDLYEAHENDIVTAGDCLYGVSRGANDLVEAAATKTKNAAAATVIKTAVAASAANKSSSSTTGGNTNRVPKTKKGARDFNNTFDRHKTEIVLANRNLQAKKVEEKMKMETPFMHDAHAAALRKKILAGEPAEALPKSHRGIAAAPTDPSKQTIPLDIDAGGRPVKAGAYDVDAHALDEEMAALVDGAVDEAKGKEEAQAAATKKSKAAKSKKSGGAPAWAMTADEADELEAAEEEELLAFADNLDFDSYVESIDEEDLNEAKAALDALVAAAAEEGGDFDEEVDLAGGSQSAEHLARVDAWKSKFLDAINRVREAEDKVYARKTAIRTARAAVALAGTTTAAGGGDVDGVSAAAFASDGGAVSAKEKAADAEAKRLLDNFPELAKVHSTRSLKGVLERTAKPPTPGPSRPGTASSSMSFGGGGGGGKSDAAAALATVEE